MTQSDLINVSQRIHVMTISVNTVIHIGMDMTRSDLINVSQRVQVMAISVNTVINTGFRYDPE